MSVAGAGAGAAVSVVVVVIVAVESAVAVASVELLPQEVTNRPMVRASTLSFTNFIVSVFLIVMHVYTQKGNR